MLVHEVDAKKTNSAVFPNEKGISKGSKSLVLSSYQLHIPSILKREVVRHSNVILMYVGMYWPKDKICPGHIQSNSKLCSN